MVVVVWLSGGWQFRVVNLWSQGFFIGVISFSLCGSAEPSAKAKCMKVKVFPHGRLPLRLLRLPELPTMLTID